MLLGLGFETQQPKSVPGLHSNFWVFPADVCFRLDSIASIGPHSDATQSDDSDIYVFRYKYKNLQCEGLSASSFDTDMVAPFVTK